MTTSDQTITLEMIRSTLGTAVVCDALDSLGYRNQSPRVTLVAMTGIEKLVGRCKTTLWADLEEDDPDTYEMELKAVDGCQQDDVLISAASGSRRSGIWGELLSTAARNSGCIGALIDGHVRDVRQMAAMGFPVFARGTCPYDSMHRQKVIEVDVPVEIECVVFNAGDLVVADVDGIVVVPQEAEEEAIRRAWEKVHAENITREAIKGGMKATDAYAKYGIL